MTKRKRRAERYYRRRRTLWYRLKCIWATTVKVGDTVQDCKYRVGTIVELDDVDGDSVVMDDGQGCSLRHCCDPIPTPQNVKELRAHLDKLLGRAEVGSILHSAGWFGRIEDW